MHIHKYKLHKNKWRRYGDTTPWHCTIELVFANDFGLAYAYYNNYKTGSSNATVEIVVEGYLWICVEYDIEIHSTLKLHSWAKSAINAILSYKEDHE